MFTGIIQTVGCIVATQSFKHTTHAGLHLSLQANAQFMQGVGLGDSIAIQGACMTVTSLSTDSFTVDVSHESLSKTTGLQTIGAVNLEKALSLSTPLGGHLVTGHVDGLGTVLNISAVGESWQLIVTVPPGLAHFFAAKGSAVINGVSLTVNTLVDNQTGCDLAFNLIPHTWENTTLSTLKVGAHVNVEVDLIARYMGRMMERMAPVHAVASKR